MTLLLAPGFMTDADLWGDMSGELNAFGPCIDVDLSRDDSIEAMARRALAGAPPSFVMIGFSMGGYVAREIARQAPDRVAGLVLIATSARADTPDQERRKALQATRAGRGAFGGLTRAAIASTLHPDRMDDAELIERIRAMSVRLGADVFRRQCMLARPGDLDRLSDIRCPTLILAAAADRVRTMAEAKELHAGIAGSDLVVVEGAGHMLPLEAPDRLAKIIVDWIAARGLVAA
jgi:pimeloyl-ACP methyl ester carboxylesterase